MIDLIPTPGDVIVRRLPPKEAYAVLAPHYDALPNPMIALERSPMLALLPRLEGLKVADLGCGTGRHTESAMARGVRNVLALDLSTEMLNRVVERCARDPRVMTVGGDLESLPLCSRSLDGVICGLALGYAKRLDRAVSEIARVLKAGGFALISDLHPVGPSLGWEREYWVGANGKRERIVVEHHTYTFEQLFELLCDNDLFLEELVEVPVGRTGLRFARTLRERLRVRRLRRVPAVAVLLLRKYG